MTQRMVAFEFDRVEQAMAAHDGAPYQEAPRAPGNGAERDLRIVPGVE